MKKAQDQFVAQHVNMHPNNTVLEYSHGRLKFGWNVASQMTLVAPLEIYNIKILFL